MALRADQIAVTSSATPLFSGLVGTVTIIGSAVFTLGGSNVTSSNGATVPANIPFPLRVNGEAVFAVTSSTAQVGYIAGAQ